MRRAIPFMFLAMTVSGCGFGASASMAIGPRFDVEGTSWAVTVAVSPVTYLEPERLPTDRMSLEPRPSAYAPGLSMRAFGGVGLDKGDLSVAPGVGLGFNPYMLLRPDGQPVFDAHLGFQAARAFGGSNGLEVGPRLFDEFPHIRGAWPCRIGRLRV